MTDLGSQGGKKGATYKAPEQGGTPKTGFDSAPKGEAFTFATPRGIGGTGKTAH